VLQFQVQIIGPDRQLLHSLPCQVKDKSDLWDQLADIASSIDVQGSRLHVIDAEGETIIRVGIVSARQTVRSGPIAA
jgi:hypothetical protein